MPRVAIGSARLVCHPLPAPHQSGQTGHGAESLLHGLRREGKPHLLTQDMQGREHSLRVARLRIAEQFAIYRPILLRMETQCVVGRQLIVVGHQRHLRSEMEKSSPLLRLLGDRIINDRLCALAEQQGNASLGDTCLLSGDLSQGIAQELGMVEADIGDNAEQRRDDVGTIQPTAQPYLDHGNIHGLLLEILKGHRRGQFKERGMQRLKESPVPLHEIHHVGLARLLAIHPDTLPEIK